MKVEIDAEELCELKREVAEKDGCIEGYRAAILDLNKERDEAQAENMKLRGVAQWKDNIELKMYKALCDNLKKERDRWRDWAIWAARVCDERSESIADSIGAECWKPIMEELSEAAEEEGYSMGQS